MKRTRNYMLSGILYIDTKLIFMKKKICHDGEHILQPHLSSSMFFSDK